jgi:solute carrier family 7 (L-type amino acid transporter), member 6
MSSEAIQLLEGSHRPPPQQNQREENDDENDNDDTLSGDGLLAGSPPEDLEMSPSNPPRSLTYVNSLAIVIGLQIGAGIFSTPAVIRTDVATTTAAVLVWTLAGILVWMGASAFIELGTRIPHNGGMQEYLWHCYGDAYGFVFAWAWILLSRPCAMAMVALVCSEYLFKTLSPDHDVDIRVLKGTALLAISGITLLNLMGTNVGAGFANIFLVLKIFTLGTIAIAGVAFAVGDLTRAEPVGLPAALEPGDWSLWASIGGFADAVLASLFAYGGNESVSMELHSYVSVLD